MTRHIVTLLLIVLSISEASAQYDFENWYNASGQFLADDYGVSGSMSSNDFTFFMGQSFTKSTNAYEGEYSAKLTSKLYNGKLYPASFAPEYHEINYLDLDYLSIQPDYYLDELLLKGNAVKINCYHVFDEQVGTEFGLLCYKIFAADFMTVKATGTQKLKSSLDWQQTELEFTYDFEQGDMIQIIVYGNQSSTKNSMYLDNLSYTSEVVSSIKDDHEDLENIVYPNLIIAGQDNTLTINDQIKQKVCTLMTLDGQEISKIQIHNHKAILPVLSSGMYFINFEKQVVKIVVK